MGPIKECRLGYEDLIDKERFRDATQFTFGALPKPLYKATDEQGKTLLDRMTQNKNMFALYGLLSLTANKWGLSQLTFRQIKELLGVGNDTIMKARDGLVNLGLVLCEIVEERNSRELKHPIMKWQITSLPIWVVQQMGIRKRGHQQKDELTETLDRYGLTKGYGRFLSEPEQDQILVKVTRAENIDPEIQDFIKRGVRTGKIRVKK